MDALDFLALSFVAAGVWLWFDSLKARESAVAATRAACRAERLLLLDDTVAITRIGLRRDEEGRVRLLRVYGFEYSDTGDERSAGSTVMLDDRLLTITLGEGECRPTAH